MSNDSSSTPSNDEIKAAIRRLIPTVDLQETGIKAFIKLLGKEFPGTNLKPRNTFIKEALSEAINEMSSDEESSEEENDDDVKRPKTKAGGGGLQAKKQISKELADFLGKGTEMARTEIVKSLWEYIRKHNLQNPENKREIFLDERMQTVFQCDKFTMFTMNKYISAHVHPFKPVDLTPKEKSNTNPSKKRKRKDKDKQKTKKQGSQPPYKLSQDLQDIVNKEVLPRPQVVQAIWKYIKDNELQNPDDKREIICDEKLKKIMGGKAKVTMFNMNTHISNHLLEKLDKSAYSHDASEP